MINLEINLDCQKSSGLAQAAAHDMPYQPQLRLPVMSTRARPTTCNINLAAFTTMIHGEPTVTGRKERRPFSRLCGTSRATLVQLLRVPRSHGLHKDSNEITCITQTDIRRSSVHIAYLVRQLKCQYQSNIYFQWRRRWIS